MMNRIRRPVALLLAMALLYATACYSYRPVIATTPTVGERVRLGLTIDGTNELARYLGPLVVSVEGQLHSTSETGYDVAVDFVQMSSGIRQEWSGEGVVTIPKFYVTTTHQRTFLKRQTIIAAGIAVAVLVITAKIALNNNLFGTDLSGGGAENP